VGRFLAILLVAVPLPVAALTLVRPLDPAGKIPGTISIYFEYYAHTAPGPSAGTVVATEGGPGFPATESRAAYLALLQPLRATHDVVIMDNRGTGRSGAIDCKELQSVPLPTEANIGACGRSLGAMAPLYSTTLAADDLAAVLDSLSIRQVSLYGDSYGTYFAQVFALRHPERMRALILDGAYPLGGPDYPWYPHYAPATRAKFNLACERDPACKGIPGSSVDHINPTLARLRAKPFKADVRHGDGQSTSVTADASALAIVMFGGWPEHEMVRELDAAARAFDGGDSLPLLRLMAETFAGVDSRDPTHSPLKFSSGLAAAVSCQDPPQIVDMNLAPARRVRARDLAIAKRKETAPDTYAPFTLDEYRRMPVDYAFIDQCMQWPAPGPGARALPLVPGVGPTPAGLPAGSGRGPHARASGDPARTAFPGMPVLVVSGEFDSVTSMADGAAAAAQFPNARHVVIANSFHVNALPHARSECGAILVRRFIETLDIGDDSCAAAVRPVRLVPRFARHVRELDPARALAGNTGDEDALRTVTAALMTSEDVIVRVNANGAGRGIGLRGGSFDAGATATGYRARLSDARWTEDISVSGVVEWRARGTVNADLELRGASTALGKLKLQWGEGAVAIARGELGGKAIVAEAPAP
jgi:pimeloyl-ACP methyl ester carboxylesterase